MALSESRKKKLQMLLRSVPPGRVTTADRMSELVERDGGTGAGVRAPKPLPLRKACPGSSKSIRFSGRKARFWLVRRQLAEVAPDSLHVARQYSAVMRGARQNFDELAASAALCHAANVGPGDLLFLDTETCGLAGSAVFLVGLMFYENRQLVFEQYLARDYAEEAGILAAFARRYRRAGVLVTFNGKTFDMTMIRERSAFHGIRLPDCEPAHLDLLHESRRRWRHSVPNCRLQTLERHFCGRRRVGDIAGAEIPDAYHQFVKTSDATRIKDILHHNLLDLLTLAELLCAIMTGCEPARQ